jgi:transcriptional regulator with XRE-family HTH domain
MREQVGLSRREFARQLNTSHTNINSWEKSGWITKSEFLAPAAAILGVSVEDLLGLPPKRNNHIPGGKLGLAFEAASKLPRSKQNRVIDLLEAFIAQHSQEETQAS